MTSPLDRRRFLSLLAAPAVLGVLHSCGSGDVATDRSEDPVTNSDAVARSTRPRETVCTCDASIAVEAINGAAIDLVRFLIATDGSSSNVVCSPASIVTALAMTRAGAVGATADEMDRVLHVSDAEMFPSSMNAVQLGFDERNRTIDVPTSDEPAEITLSFANSLWAQRGAAFEGAFLDALAVQYGAGVQLVDYRRDADGARRAINAWVADETADRIAELLEPGTVTADVRLTLVNTIFFRAPWQKPFDASITAELPFTTDGGDVVRTPTMRQTERFGYATAPGWQAIELPYAGSLLSMLVVLPDGGATIDDAIASLPTLADAVRSERVAITLPTFDIEARLDLAETLAAMGMPTAFDAERADFTAMAIPDPGDPEPLFIGEVVHQATVTVDEAGTEAAAATAIAMAAGSAAAPAEPIVFTVDRPFLFAIRDNPTGAIVFLGHIADPTQRRG